MSGLSKVRNPMGRVLHDRETGSSKVPAAGIGETTLGHAVQELEAQHPQHHSVGGVHGTSDHIRHTTTTKGPHGYGDNIQPGRSHGYPSGKHR